MNQCTMGKRCVTYAIIIFLGLIVTPLSNTNAQSAVLFLSPLGSGVYEVGAWSLDGKYLAFAFHDRTFIDQLWLLEVETGDLTQIEIEGEFEYYAGISWHGNSTVWFMTREGSRFHGNQEYYRIFSSNIQDNEVEIVLELSLQFRLGQGWQGLILQAFSVHPFEDQITLLVSIDNTANYELYSFDMDNQELYLATGH